MMTLINKDQFESCPIKLRQSITRIDALNRCYCDVGEARGMQVSHFYLNGFIGVHPAAVACSLLDKFPAMNEDKCLACILNSVRYLLNQVRKDDL